MPSRSAAPDDGDFSYDFLGRLYDLAVARGPVHVLGDAAEVLADGTPCSFIRHDVDVSIDRAVRLARWESGRNIRSTYHVMLSCPFYDPRSDTSLADLREIADLGHEVGLHYDVNARGSASWPMPDRERDIGAACAELEAALDSEVRSVSFHRPIPELLDGPLTVAGRVSGYASPLFTWYLSDSRARWREGDPLQSLGAPRSHVLQLLVHPVWWGPSTATPAQRLAHLVTELAERTDRSYESVRSEMVGHIDVIAADLADARP